MAEPWEDAPIVKMAPAPWESAPIVQRASPREDAPIEAQVRREERVGEGILDALTSGYQSSATGLALRGRLPDIVLDPEHAKWYEKLLSGVSQVVSELPQMTVGAFTGGAAGAGVGSAVPVVGTAIGGLIGAGAGTFAMPTLMRESLMQAYEAREVESSGEFLARTGIVIKQTAKSAVVGGLTFGVGKYAQVATKAFGKGAMTAADIAAQTSTMTVASAALEGKLPEPVDFMNAAIMVTGGKAAHVTATKIRNIYARTGITPEQVAADAARNPSLKAELREGKSEQIPEAYKEAERIEIGRTIVPGEKAAEYVESPFTELPGPKSVVKPTQVNLRYVSSAEDAQIAHTRLSEIYEAEIQTQRRGTVEHRKSVDAALAMLKNTAEGKDVRLLLKRKPGTAAGDAEILARKFMLEESAKELRRTSDAYDAKVEAGTVTPIDTAKYLESVERAGVIQAEFLGARAEIGRALNALKVARDAAGRAEAIEAVVSMYKTEPATLAKMIKALDTPEGVLKFTRKMREATTWEKVVEAWKAGLVSGPITHLANIIGNTTFLMVRTPIDVLAGAVRGVRGGEGARMGEALSSITAMMHGTAEAFRVTGAALRTESFRLTEKGELIRPAIEGRAGRLIRLPFRVLQAEDMFFRTLNKAAETHRIAFRQALKDGFDPRSKEFAERVAEIAQNPGEKIAKQIEDAGARFTFNMPLGEKGRAVQHLVRKWHLEWAVPFVRTPGNIAKELVRMSPAAPLVKEWRLDIAKGGAAADKAVAEIMLGSSIGGLVTGLALNGIVTGAGDPDISKKWVDIAAGNPPYSIKIGGEWYSYGRLQPIGTLMGLSADMAEIWELMNDEERDLIPKKIGIAFANAITNQTFLQGITNIVNAMTDFNRYGARGINTLAGSVVPGLISQTAQLMDPFSREIDGALTAIKFRVPIWRESLLLRRDPFGAPIPRKERVLGITPIEKVTPSTDPVRLEASRLGVGVAKTPTSAELPAAGERKLGQVKLTPEQQDIFAKESGELAHQILTPIVTAPDWNQLPDLVQRRIYETVFTRARKVAMSKAFPPEQRAIEADRISQELMKRLLEKREN